MNDADLVLAIFIGSSTQEQTCTVKGQPANGLEQRRSSVLTQSNIRRTGEPVKTTRDAAINHSHERTGTIESRKTQRLKGQFLGLHEIKQFARAQAINRVTVHWYCGQTSQTDKKV